MTETTELRRLIEIMARLRGPGGCPWDQEQTHHTLKAYLLEETYEVIAAIDAGGDDDLKEELGDVLLQVVFHARIAENDGRFSLEDVAKAIADKLVRRHPHVFAAVTAKDARTVVKNWEAIKRQEKQARGKIHKSLLDGVPRAFPALFEAKKLGRKTAQVGFDWPRPVDVFEKVAEELAETKAAARRRKQDALEEELGDLLFAVVNLCRVYQVDPELALKGSNRKFRRRFAAMERSFGDKPVTDIGPKKWQDKWQKAKSSS